MRHRLGNVACLAVALILLVVVAWRVQRGERERTHAELVRQAEELVAGQDWNAARATLQRALRIDSGSATATGLMADVLETAQDSEALEWRRRSVDLEPGSDHRRFALALTALRVRDLKIAGSALTGVSQAGRSSAEYHRLRGALDWSRGRLKEAEQNYREALRLEPEHEVTAVNLAAVQLDSADELAVREARAALVTLAQAPNTRLIALRRLRSEALLREDFGAAEAHSRELLADPRVDLADKQDHLRLLHRVRSPRYLDYLAELRTEAAGSPEIAAVVARWSALMLGPRDTLKWIQTLPVDIRVEVGVALSEARCLVRLQNWAGLLALLEGRNWGDEEYQRLALMAWAHRAVGDQVPAGNLWNEAFRRAVARLDRLVRLAHVAAGAGWPEQRSVVLMEILASFPGERWALEELMKLHYQAGDSLALQRLLRQTLANQPDDTRVQNDLAYVSLLRGSELGLAHVLARQTRATLPNDPAAVSTYALSLFLQGRTVEATEALSHPVLREHDGPALVVCRALILDREEDQQRLRRLMSELASGSASLLPEERKLAEQALAGRHGTAMVLNAGPIE